MDRIVGILNNRYLLAAMAALFLLGLFAQLKGRR